MFFKRWGKSAEEKFRDKVKDKIDGLKPAKTKGGQNIGLVEMIYFAVVIGIMFLLLGLIKGDSWGALIVLLATVAALSHQIRGAVIPPLYDMVAEKAGWPSFAEAQRNELEAREGKTPGTETKETPRDLVAPATIEPTSAPVEPTPGEDPRVPQVLYHFTKLEPAEQTTQAMTVFQFLRGVIQHPFFELVDAVAEPERPAIAQKALLMLAQQKGISSEQ